MCVNIGTTLLCNIPYWWFANKLCKNDPFSSSHAWAGGSSAIVWSRIFRRPCVCHPHLKLSTFQKMLNGKWGNLTKKIISSSNGVLFTSIWKQRWPTCHLTTSLLRATAERNLTKLDKKSKYSNVLYQVCSFYSGRWRPPWPLIGWNIFGSFSATLQRNFTKLDWKQVLLASIVYFFFSGRCFNKCG